MTTIDTKAIVDGSARVIAGAIDGHIFAAGVTQSVLDNAPLVVPIARDFTEAGLPAVTCAMGPWDPALQPANERLRMTILCAVWREAGELGQNVNLLYDDRDAIADAWIAHSKAYLTEVSVQSAILAGGPGIVPRSLGDPGATRNFVTLPFSVNVVCVRVVVPQPA
jgi:hypothetical protein